MNKATKAITNSEILSISKKITMLEMKELNERQRAEHSQRMYEHLRSTVKQVEERNFELETKFAEVNLLRLQPNVRHLKSIFLSFSKIIYINNINLCQ